MKVIACIRTASLERDASPEKLVALTGKFREILDPKVMKEMFLAANGFLNDGQFCYIQEAGYCDKALATQIACMKACAFIWKT